MADPVLISGDVRRALFIRQIMFLFAIAASVAVGVYVVLWSQKPNYSLLYGSLSDQDASQVLESLQKANIDYHLDPNSGAVMVASAKVHEARMKLAAEGLPRSASSGFSMLNEEQKLGTSQFMEKARYQNALENELAMSISKVSAVRAARVHLALPKESVFLRNRKAASASVLLDLYPGHRLEAGQVAAIANLIASSVPSLELSNVSIIDQQGHLMSQNQSSADLALTASQFQYATQVENSYIERIENILVPLLGPDGVKAQVTAEMDFTKTEQTRESYNPDMAALRSEQVEEDRSSSANITGGVPGALSNQPAVDGSAPEEASESSTEESNSSNNKAGSGSSQSRATRNYELDKTISHTHIASGNLVRLSVAVVIDYKKSVNDKGEVIRVEHTPEELEQITNLVKETIGFNIIRGDRVNVMNSQFSLPEAIEPLPEAPIWKQAWVWDIAKQVFGGLFVLFLVFGILRPSIKNMMNKEITLHQTALAGPGGDIAKLTADSDDAKEMKALEAAPEYDRSISNVKEMVATDPKLAAQVVRNWVGED